ncbi:MAG: hypothetical protein R3F55_10525 [Alphaproteobacteria bacterium]
MRLSHAMLIAGMMTSVSASLSLMAASLLQDDGLVGTVQGEAAPAVQPQDPAPVDVG